VPSVLRPARVGSPTLEPISTSSRMHLSSEARTSSDRPYASGGVHEIATRVKVGTEDLRAGRLVGLTPEGERAECDLGDIDKPSRLIESVIASPVRPRRRR
jgi:hypothetical protein